jgi:hypothetical protein
VMKTVDASLADVTRSTCVVLATNVSHVMV